MKSTAIMATLSGLAVGSGIETADNQLITLRLACSVGATVFFIGMWLSKKLTQIETKIEANAIARAEAFESLNKRIEKIERFVSQFPCPKCPQSRKLKAAHLL